MECIEIKPNLYYVGVIDHSLQVFDVTVKTSFGSSYNSYLLKTSEGLVVFEGSKQGFADEYIEHLQSFGPLTNIKYLVVSHTEPDHSGAIDQLLEVCPNITVVASQGALVNLKKIVTHDFKSIVARPDETLKIGEYTLLFVSGVMLHWPDVMFTYIEELKSLVCCDAFGAHYAADCILLSKLENKTDYEQSFDYYYQNIMFPFAPYVLQACDRVDKLEIEMLLVGHGPIVDCDVSKKIKRYRELATMPPYNPKKVVIVYGSAYGYTKQMAFTLADKYMRNGKQVVVFRIDALNYDKIRDHIIREIVNCDHLLLGSPTIVGDAVSFFYDLLAHIPMTMCHGKTASVFGDYGWSGEAVANLSQRLEQLHFTVIPGFRVNFRIDEAAQAGLLAYYETIKF